MKTAPKRILALLLALGLLLSLCACGQKEQTVPDEEKRCIMLKVFRKDNLLCIHAENYCTENLKFKDNLPVTTKGSTDYHGFGLKSVRYVVKKYGGNLSVGLRDNMFVVDIIMPVAAGGAK